MIPSNPINILPLDVSALLAAGQVIDSLSGVVRELVENSLDAGADRLVISLWPYLWRLQVVDNGCGMSLRDLRLACAPHSTSKIAQEQDLHCIRSLGFRGEALFSLTQFADVEILSRCATPDALGWRLIYREGKQVSETSVAIAPGTIINVTNLFSNWQVRREALTNKSHKLKNVQKMIGQMALCHPHVHWQVRVDDQLWFKISPSFNPLDILPQIIKPVGASDLAVQEVHFPNHGAIGGERMTLVMGLPDRCHRQRPDWVKIAVNGRVVQSGELEQTILSTTSRILPRDRYPLCFLHLHICPSQIDWNRHPAKSEVYIHTLSFYQEQIKAGIEGILKLNLDPQVSNQRVKQMLKVAEAKQPYCIDNPHSEISLINLKAVAQINNTYIVTEHPTGLWLIEQHIAHERILYERLQQDWRLVSLEKPIVLNLLSSKAVEQLQSLGLEVEAFGEQAWAVRNAPALLAERSDCPEALLELSQGGDLQAAQVATACRSAIRNGTPLSLTQMQSIVNDWKITRNPRTCPHGRPIYLSLEESALARFFRRHWVIGKSHGLSPT
ncbi:DNA mismatch repair endonuclease MutL [Gloeocapsa sp. PCC 73106]|uniref:DNA mismatch repair endonuclease MutL n=1 Tax=Gloeocapsa sp. PCC 73106 TaxID=102232 RepID=UPI0002AC8F58|nr:DNA mismatch repair endonuclease MutL [Gloeocapsa sp. PCC 73106]ELR97664.1 DNA mismatch repair enzyme (predicted ATPase) [Gloeocapsa sp. PCC 73106]